MLVQLSRSIFFQGTWHIPTGVQRSGDGRGDCLIGCPPYEILVLSSGVWWSLLLDICCFVTSQYDVIFTFANQRFDEVC